MGSSLDSGYFSEAYSSARLRFLQAAWELQKQSLKAEHFELPLSSKLNESLSADAIYFPATEKARKLFILSSGIHGAEAPLGSAIQLYFLRRVLPFINRSDTGILLFHSLNPYGFYTGRRVTENNVDLNRNFLTSESDFKILRNVAYEKLQHLIAPEQSVDHYFLDKLTIGLRMLRHAMKGVGARQKLRQAFAGGQYSDSKGIFYGGRAHEPQVKWVANLLDKIIPSHEEVLLYDVHSGLGRAEAIQMIASLKCDPRDTSSKKLNETLKNETGIFFVSPETDGFYTTSGDFVDFVYAKAIKHGARVAAYTAEFGTLGETVISQLSTSVRIILENRGYHWGYALREIEWKVKKSFTELFNPSMEAWRQNALRLADKILYAALSAGKSTYSQLSGKSEAGQ